jgi:hypothetical protein
LGTTNPLNTARWLLAGAGIQTSALAFGGSTNSTEEYDGTSWTASNNLNINRGELAGAGIQTSALAFGGGPTGTPTEQYDGTSWTTVANLPASKKELAGNGNTTQALSVAGQNSPGPGAVVATSEEWTGAGPLTVTITAS